MLDRLRNGEISTALDELIAFLGVKEDIKSHNLVNLLRDQGAKTCVQEIAHSFGLPVRIELSYVPENFIPNNPNRFHSTAVAKTDWTGQGVEGITAQVAIPSYIPTYGSASLNNYPIQVRVSTNSHLYPDTFITLMAHEISHVLLASIRSDHWNSELHTDLVPVVLGFKNIMTRGRKVIENNTSGNQTITETSTFGYLTDAQFEFACRYVTRLLSRYKKSKKRLLAALKQTESKVMETGESLYNFRKYFDYLDHKPPEKMRRDHALKLVELHAQDYSREWENKIENAKKTVKNEKAFAVGLKHYRKGTSDLVKTHIHSLNLAFNEMNKLHGVISENNEILRRYVGLFYKLREFLFSRPKHPAFVNGQKRDSL